MRVRTGTLTTLAGAALLSCVAGQTFAQTSPITPVVALSSTAGKPVAYVNSEAITQGELDSLLKTAGPTAMPLNELQKQQVRDDALNVIIEDVLMHQFLRQSVAAAKPEQVAQEFATIESELKKKTPNKTLQDLFKESGLSEAEWRVQIGYRLQWMAYCQAKVTDEVVKQYYDQNKEFFDNVTVRASHILLRIDPKATEMEVSAAKAKLTALRQQLLENKLEFAAAAEQYSECPTAKEGGDLGFFPRKGMDENFAKTAFALQPGQLSDVVQTEFGLHLIKVVEHKPGTPSDFTKIKEDVRMFYIAEMQQNLINYLRKNAKIEKSL